MKRQSDRGFTLLEVIAALGILSIVLSIVMSGFLTNLRSNLRMQIRYEATQAAQKVIDGLRFDDLVVAAVPSSTDVTIGSRSYHVDVSYCQLAQYCATSDIRHVTVDVSYKSQQIYETDTVFAKFY